MLARLFQNPGHDEPKATNALTAIRRLASVTKSSKLLAWKMQKQPRYTSGDQRHSGWSSYNEFYQNSRYAQFQQLHYSTASKDVSVFKSFQDTVYETDPATEQFRVVMLEDCCPTFKGRVGYGGSQTELCVSPGDIFIEPSHTDITYDLSGRHDIMSMQISVHSIISAFECDWAAFRSVQERYWFDQPHNQADCERLASVGSLLSAIWRASQAPSNNADLVIESCGISVAALFAEPLLERPRHRPLKLEDPRLARAIDYIEAELATSLRLEDIARVACVSTYHFSRSFKAATGLTVHNYVLLRRLTRAKELLAKTHIPIAQIAFDVGFASQAHMTDVFRSRVGITPMRYREQATSGTY